jgi:hypothetical protein
MKTIVTLMSFGLLALVHFSFAQTAAEAVNDSKSAGASSSIGSAVESMESADSNRGSSHDFDYFDLARFQPGTILSVEHSSSVNRPYKVADTQSSEMLCAVFDPDRSLGLSGQYDVTTMPVSERHFAENFKKAIITEGIAHVRYNLQNGPIQKGDYITISDEPGEGMKATESGFTVGVALENSDATEKPGLIRVRVMVRYERF